jgi:RNA polymerase sigma-70 factor (ECF subfamily)
VEPCFDLVPIDYHLVYKKETLRFVEGFFKTWSWTSDSRSTKRIGVLKRLCSVMRVPEDVKQAEAQFVLLFDVFYAQTFAGVLAMTLGLTRHRWLAEEVTQEAFTRAHRDWDTIAVHPSPEAWVRRVALNLCRSSFRRASAEARALVRLGPPEVVAPPDESVVYVWESLSRLSRRQREVVVLFYFNDLPVAEVAGLLGIAEGTVRATLAHARDKLAEVLS